jgi:hypothetical protein
MLRATFSERFTLFEKGCRQGPYFRGTQGAKPRDAQGSELQASPEWLASPRVYKGDSFVDVVRRMVLQPTTFFADLPRQGSVLGPLLFALICIEVSVALVGLLTFLSVPGGVTWLFGARGDQGFLAFVGGLVIAPIAGTVGVFLTALVTHLLVILVVGSGHSGFGATFRIISYSSVTSLLGWLPFIGWIFSLYRLYLATVGIREMHSTTTGKALLVVLLPAILILLLILVVVGASAIVYFRAA